MSSGSRPTLRRDNQRPLKVNLFIKITSIGLEFLSI